MDALQLGIERTADLLRSAAVGQISWREPLESMAALTGSTGAQLIGLGSEVLVSFNTMTGVPPETSHDFVLAGGGDPAINSRVRIGSQAPLLDILDEADFTTAEDMRRNEAYADWIRRYDMHHACLTTLDRGPESLVGLALIRSEREGFVEEERKRAFALLATHARSAVKTQILLQNRNAQILTGALEAMRATVFICDADGRVHSMTPSAEALLVAGDALRLEGRYLSCVSPTARSALDAAIGAALAGDPRPRAPVAVRKIGSDEALLVETATLPSEYYPGFGPRALVIVHGCAPDKSRMAGAARALFGLTEAEANIAVALALGRSPAVIAHDRGVSLGTVRVQLRQIYDKAGVASQRELAAKLNRL